MFESATIFRQTLMVLVGWLVLVLLVISLALAFPARGGSRRSSISDIAVQMADPSCAASDYGRTSNPPTTLEAMKQHSAPQRGVGMEDDPDLVAQLAYTLSVQPSDIRLYWKRGTEIRLNRPVPVSIEGRTSQLNQTVFLDNFIAARRWPSYWCVATMPAPPWYKGWLWNAVLINALCLLAMLPLAWFFARRLSRPIRDFAVAADRIGKDTTAPLLQEAGPQEVRVAARALNAMQGRIQSQLKEREAMVVAIAHDLRTPLSRIAFRVERAADELRDPVQRDIGQMQAMIAATIEHYRSNRVGRADERVDLRVILSSMADEERAMGHDIRTDMRAAAEVKGDTLELNRLFQNLIDNAKKFAGSAEISLTADGNKACVTVADRGAGIPSAQIANMFMPFTRGEPSRNRETGGVGLGLSIARAIARQHGGDLVLSNRTGGGLLAEVILPLASDAN